MKSLGIDYNDNILVIAPHPDDESIWCGWLLLKYPNQCSVLVVTDWRYWWLDSDSEIVMKRRIESENAMKSIWIKNLEFLGIEDTKLNINVEYFCKYDFTKYTKIFCPNNKDFHVDHACVLNLLKKTTYNNEIYLYEVRSTLTNPSHYIDISLDYLKKRELIKIYESQISQLDYSKKILSLNNYRGMQVYPAISYAEVYEKIQI